MTDWLPREMAKENGTPVLSYPVYGMFEVIAFRKRRWRMSSGEGNVVWTDFVWRPLPDPPKRSVLRFRRSGVSKEISPCQKTLR